MQGLLRLPRRANYFFALLPDPVAAASADRMAQALGNWFGLSRPTRRTGKYHVTLWGWPWRWEPDGQELASMRRAGGRIAQDAFRLTLDEVATFAQASEKPALVLTGGDTLIGAYRLHDGLDQEMRSNGCRSPGSPCHPHLTLLYDHFRTKALRVRPLSWWVTEFVLIRSVPTRPYEILGRWPLASR